MSFEEWIRPYEQARKLLLKVHDYGSQTFLLADAGLRERMGLTPELEHINAQQRNRYE